MILPLISVWNYPAHIKLTTPHSVTTALFNGPHPVVCFSLNLNKSTSYLLLCLSVNYFTVRHQEPEFHQALKPDTMGFGWAQVLGERSWGTRGKSSGKNVPRDPLHNLPENLLNTWPMLTVFIGLIFGTKKIKDRRTPTHLGNSTRALKIVETSGHPGVPTAACLFSGVQGNKKQEIVKELRFC